jgi:hypothetical protein
MALRAKSSILDVLTERLHTHHLDLEIVSDDERVMLTPVKYTIVQPETQADRVQIVFWHKAFLADRFGQRKFSVGMDEITHIDEVGATEILISVTLKSGRYVW